MKQHKIISTSKNSIAWEMKVEPGDILLSIDGQEIKDILDYRFLIADESIIVELQKPNGEIWELEIEKDSDDDLGLFFSPESMGEDRRCANACIFCFVDQQPPGLRESLYVKDDDPYQSFALGNYITLTNLESEDIDQIIKYRLSPMRISVHAGDMSLRRMMMGSIRAGYLFKILERFLEAGIDMHFQVVLCKGINDEAQLDNTIERLLALGDRAQSLAVVPVGLTQYREGLYPLERFTPDDARAVIVQVEGWQSRLLKERGCRFVFLADEWYVLAGVQVPVYDEYEGFPQLDNGVGMMALFETEFLSALKKIGSSCMRRVGIQPPSQAVGLVTGQAAEAFMGKLATKFTQTYPDTAITIHAIQNDFYGSEITVSGLLTGQDIINQLKEKCEGLDILFLPGNAFRSGSDEMLCGTTLGDISKALGVNAIKGSADGGEFCEQLIKSVRG